MTNYYREIGDAIERLNLKKGIPKPRQSLRNRVIIMGIQDRINKTYSGEIFGKKTEVKVNLCKDTCSAIRLYAKKTLKLRRNKYYSPW